MFFEVLTCSLLIGRLSFYWSGLYQVAVPNRFIRIAPNGRISYSQRLTITATCRMDLTKFPLDMQVCPLYIGEIAEG